MESTPRRVPIQFNPTSGSGRKHRKLLELVRCLRRSGLRPRLFSRRERLTAWLGRSENRDDCRCIVAAGGDGTVGDVLNRYPGLPVAIFPLGTENLLAKFLGIRASAELVTRMIAAGQSRSLDLCTLGELRFAIMASCGFDAAVVHRTHAARRGHITQLSYLWPTWQTLCRYRYPRVRLFLDDAESPLVGVLAEFVNVPAYALGLPVARSARGDDGQIDVRLFQRPSAFHLIRYCYKVLRGKHESLPDVISARASRVRVESDDPVPVQVDGDPAGWTPTEIRVLPGAAEFLIPERRTDQPPRESSEGVRRAGESGDNW